MVWDSNQVPLRIPIPFIFGCPNHRAPNQQLITNKLNDVRCGKNDDSYIPNRTASNFCFSKKKKKTSECQMVNLEIWIQIEISQQHQNYHVSPSFWKTSCSKQCYTQWHCEAGNYFTKKKYVFWICKSQHFQPELGNAVHISIPISPCTSPERVPQRQVVSTRLGLLFRNRKKRVFGYCWHFWWPSAGRLEFIPSAINF